ncbi:hypothetical protein EB796_013136 [Bugula neritina]|uniref:Uncharacterized protein n=1 Tax=Bugula neritina TaxID=10212 RepID=A0A7J7JSV3_BUGNE|nr:hypothetical protein EB796_013136 [Bugula neritina]
MLYNNSHKQIKEFFNSTTYESSCPKTGWQEPDKRMQSSPHNPDHSTTSSANESFPDIGGIDEDHSVHHCPSLSTLWAELSWYQTTAKFHILFYHPTRWICQFSSLKYGKLVNNMVIYESSVYS